MQCIAKFLTNPLLYIWIGLLVSLYKFRGNRRRLIILNIMFYCLSIGYTGSTLSSLWKVDNGYNENYRYIDRLLNSNNYKLILQKDILDAIDNMYDK